MCRRHHTSSNSTPLAAAVQVSIMAANMAPPRPFIVMVRRAGVGCQGMHTHVAARPAHAALQHGWQAEAEIKPWIHRGHLRPARFRCGSARTPQELCETSLETLLYGAKGSHEPGHDLPLLLPLHRVGVCLCGR